MNRYWAVSVAGLLFGLIVLHPSAMLIQGVVHPGLGIELSKVLKAYDIHHISMAVFFGVIGVAFAATIIFYTARVSKGQERISVLESMLPVCAWCKRIRDDEGKEKGSGDWYHADAFLKMKAGAEFTHGICHECLEKEILNKDDEGHSGNCANEVCASRS